MPGFLYAGDLVLCDESEEELKVMVGRFLRFVEERGLKVNPDKSKVIVLGVEEGLGCEVHVDGAQLKQVSEFKYFGCVFNE